ncbi:hypothetical protein [Amycolatopsis japonica]
MKIDVLARYRAWLMALTAFTVALVTVVPVRLLDRGAHDPATVWLAVGLLLSWWGALIGTWVAFERLRPDPDNPPRTEVTHG